MTERAYGLTTDLYELTMAAAYSESGINHRAIFELFVRTLPDCRSYLIAAGLEQALEYLRRLKFTADQIDYLRRHPSFKHVGKRFFDYLGELRFTGDVWAVPEGTVAFGMEPLLRVEAPIIEAQIVETFLLSTINFQTAIASKAARVVTAAQGRRVIEFGTRRAHGTEAGLLAARAAYIAGCAGTSNVEAGYTFGIPTFGTLAHSFVMSFDDEDAAFRAFLRVFPDTATLLVDTYDTISAVRRITADLHSHVPAVRLDSGDLVDLSKQVRQMLDQAGMNATRIFASGDLDEHRIAELLSRGAAIDAFGVGTQLATSYDAPALGGVYKLVEMKGGRTSMRIKLSPHKVTYPGPKQVWRRMDDHGKYAEDVIALADEDPLDAEPLLVQVMKAGRLVEDDQTEPTRERRLERLERARARAAEQLCRLREGLLSLTPSDRYPVRFSDRLVTTQRRLQEAIEAESRGSRSNPS
jgi:nicotinate phosphoribosyltransferase